MRERVVKHGFPRAWKESERKEGLYREGGRKDMQVQEKIKVTVNNRVSEKKISSPPKLRWIDLALLLYYLSIFRDDFLKRVSGFPFFCFNKERYLGATVSRGLISEICLSTWRRVLLRRFLL